MEYCWYKIRAVYKFSSVCMAHAITKHDANLVERKAVRRHWKKDWLLKIIQKNYFSQVFPPFKELQFD